jgi:ATP-dependent Lon protease
MTKRLSKENARQRKTSEDMTDSGEPPPEKKRRYNLRERKVVKDKTIWINDDTLDDEDSDSSYEEESEPKINIMISVEPPYSEEDTEDEDEEVDSFLKLLGKRAPAKRKAFDKEAIPIDLTRNEKKYYQSLDAARKKDLMSVMKRISSITIDEGEIPYKFRIMSLPVSDYTKALVIKKITALADLDNDSSSAYKLRSWVDAFLRLPFGKTDPLPVKYDDGVRQCTDFMVSARSEMDKHIYGMNGAKTQIMQLVSQWIVNPKSVGNVIALHGPPGIGKTSFARSAIASTLRRPFAFFTLGGASDVGNFVGHSYTYEGSTWGRITDALMQCGKMNPVLYFDELDKISNTPHGEEIASMLIHLTDRSQNTEFHDRYFAGIDFDLSQCLFVFSFNDIEKVHPILRDRMTVLECAGYNEKDKIQILKQHIWPDLIDRLRFKPDELIFEPDVMRYLISEYSDKEKGVRNLIRAAETVVTRLNMLRISKHESMKEYEFYMDLEFPLTLTPLIIQKLMVEKKEPENESWRHIYT